MSATPPLRVLLVEDDAAYAGMIGRVLEASHVPVTLTWASTFADATRRVPWVDIDAVVLDLNLPDSQGLDTLDRLHAAANGIPIVVLTAHDDDQLAVRAVQHGAQDYLVKGDVDGPSLVRAIRYARERASLRRELSEREARFRALVEHSSDAVALVDEHFVARYNSRSVERVCGYTPEELLGKRLDCSWIRTTCRPCASVSPNPSSIPGVRWPSSSGIGTRTARGGLARAWWSIASTTRQCGRSS